MTDREDENKTEYESGESVQQPTETVESAEVDRAGDLAAEQISEQPQEVTAEEGQPQEVTADKKPAEPPKQKKGKRIFWNVFLIVVIALGILSLFGIVNEIDPDAASLGEVLRGSSPLFICVLLAVIIVIMLLDVSKYCIISKTVTGKFHIATSAKTHFLGKYYDAVTPFSTGGQPMQIYYLNTKGNSGGNSSAMVLIRYFSSILTWIIWGAALMIWGTAKGILSGVEGSLWGMDTGKLLIITGWVGIGINLIIPVFVTLCLIFPKFMYKLTSGLVKLGAKVKIVKNVEATTERAFKIVKDFQTSFKVMATSPLKLIALLLVSLLEAGLTFAVPFFVMKAFNSPVEGKIITVMALNAFATFGVSFIPTPGNSGVVESLGALAFSVATGAAIVWSVLVWRLFVFYIYIFIGLGITIYDVVIKNKKKKAMPKKQE